MLTPGGWRAWPDRKLVELGAVQDLICSLRDAGERQVRDLKERRETNPQTPPDVLGRNETDGLIGFEVTELTDQQVIESNIPRSRERYAAMRQAKSADERFRALLLKAREQVRIWRGHEVIEEVRRIVAAKGQKTFAEESEPYAERWLVIHTSEPFVRWNEFDPSAGCGPVRGFDYVYLVADFDPLTGRYPWWQLATHTPVSD